LIDMHIDRRQQLLFGSDALTGKLPQLGQAARHLARVPLGLRTGEGKEIPLGSFAQGFEWIEGRSRWATADHTGQRYQT
jgi:hypothetical protein